MRIATDWHSGLRRLLVLLGLLTAAVAMALGSCAPEGSTSSSTSLVPTSGTSLSAPTPPAAAPVTSTPPTTVPTIAGNRQAGSAIDGWTHVYTAPVLSPVQMVSVDGGRAVWVNQGESGPGKIMLFDAGAGDAREVVTMEGTITRALISGDSLFFACETAGSSAVYLHRLSTGHTTQISAGDWGAGPQICGSHAVWSQAKPGPPVTQEYVYYDLNSGVSTVIAQAEQDHGGLGSALFLGEKWVLWEVTPTTATASSGFASYSVATGHVQEVPISYQDRPDALDGDLFYYVPGAGSDMVVIGQPQELHSYNLRTGEDKLVTKEAHGVQWTAAEGGRVAWASWDNDGRFIKTLDVATGAISRLPVPGYQVGVLQLKGNLLFWRAQRASPTATLGSGYIFAYDMQSGVATRLSDTLTQSVYEVGTDGTTVCFGQTRTRAGKTYDEVAVFARAGADEFPFSDMPGLHPYRSAVAGLASAGAFDQPEGSRPGASAEFHPDQAVTLGDFATWMVAALGLDTSGDPADVLSGLGVFEGDETLAGTTVTRAEVIRWVTRAGSSLRPGLVTAYVDYPGTDGDFHNTGDPEVAKAEWSGLVDGVVGYFDDSWDASLPASRSEAAQIIWNLTASGTETP